MPKNDPAGYLPNVKKARAQGQGKEKLKNVIMERRSKGRKGGMPTGFQRRADRKEPPVASSFKGGSGSIGSFGPKGGGNSFSASTPSANLSTALGVGASKKNNPNTFNFRNPVKGGVMKPQKALNGPAARRLDKIKGK